MSLEFENLATESTSGGGSGTIDPAVIDAAVAAAEARLNTKLATQKTELETKIEQVEGEIPDTYTKMEVDNKLQEKAGTTDVTDINTRVQALETELEAFLESPEIVPGTTYEEI